MNTTTPAPVDGAAILDALHATIGRYVILPSPQALDAVVLWIAATHAQPAWAHAPRLVIRAPERRCGKSRLLDMVAGTSYRPLITINVSTAAVYRSVSTLDDNGSPPTLLIDEADTIFGVKTGDTNEELRGLLNAGHERNRPTLRWDPNTRSLETLENFAMAALAGIGTMPDTIEDRAIIIRMRRRAPGERVAPYRIRRDGPPLRALADQLTTWLAAHLTNLEHAEPSMPLEDRAADTWEPLTAVADLAGGHWSTRARNAAQLLTTEANDITDTSDRIRLLADCRTAFGDANALPTTVLLDRLKSDPEAPWVEYAGTGLTPMRLAGLLKDYEIRSTTIRFPPPVGQAKGYLRADFTDAWNRYTPAQHDPTEDPDATSAAPEPYQPYQPYHPSSEAVRPETWYGSSRTTKTAVPGLTSTDTAGTAGTATPRLYLAGGTNSTHHGGVA